MIDAKKIFFYYSRSTEMYNQLLVFFYFSVFFINKDVLNYFLRNKNIIFFVKS
jgi:hypothetical protein